MKKCIGRKKTKMEKDCCFKRENQRFRYRAAAIIIEEGCVLFASNQTCAYYYSIGGGVHLNETSSEAVKREVFEETGIHYEIDHLAIIHENFYVEKEIENHEISFYYLMKPKGSKHLESTSFTRGVKETMHWIPIEDLDGVVAYPTFIKSFLQENPKGIIHIVSDER